MSERVVFVREQGQTEYDIMYLSETLQSPDGTEHLLTIEELHQTIKEALGKHVEISKIILDDITIKNAHGIRFLFKKPDPKIEVVFESTVTNTGGPNRGLSGSNPPSLDFRTGGYSNYQSSVIPVSIPNQGKDNNNKWLTVLEKNPFSFGHSGLTINEHLFVFGGFADEQTVNHCLLLSDIRAGKFSKLKVRGDIPPIRERHTASIIGKKVFIFGGYCRGAELYYNTLYVFESETLTWTLIETRGTPPDRRCGHSASVVDGKIWVFGGRTKTKKTVLFDSEGTGVMYKNDLHCYDPNSNEWIRYEPRGIGPSGRALHAAAVVGRKIYIFGGANSSGHGNDTSGFCDLYELDIDAMCWTECETQNTPPSPCYGSTATYIGDDRILFFGGKGYKVLNDIHILHLKNMEWKQYAFAGNTLVPRWGHSATLHDFRILIYGGRAEHGYYNTIDLIDINTELIELKPEELFKEKLKRKQEEKNKTREVIGNLQNAVTEISEMITQLGTQLVGQKKAIVETRNAMIQLRQENEFIKQQIHDLDTIVPALAPITSSHNLSGTPIFQTQNN